MRFNEADHEHQNKYSITLVIPVKTGIQEAEGENWIPACAGMTNRKENR
jgi:hypothetical protein